MIVAEDVADEQAAVELGNRISQAGRKPFRVSLEEFVCTVPDEHLAEGMVLHAGAPPPSGVSSAVREVPIETNVLA